MAHSALHGHIELVPEAVKRKFHLKATVTAKRNRIGTFRILTSRKEDFTGICLFGVGFAHDFHAAKALSNLRVCFHGFHIDNELVAEAFSALPQMEQSILILHCTLDLADGEIGNLVGMSRSAVQRHRTKALQELREALSALMPKGG